MTEIELRANLIAIEYLRMAYASGQLQKPMSMEAYIKDFKIYYDRALFTLQRSKP